MSTKRNWLKGCGIGCGALLLIVVLLVGGGFFVMRDVISDLGQIESNEKELAERFGQPVDFTPRWDGTIEPERIEIFLLVREALLASRERVEQNVDNDLQIIEGDESKGFRKVIRGLKAGVSLTGDVVDFVNTRNGALLELGMGPGEYAYLYTIVYYSWLGKDPGDGPENLELGSRDGRGVEWKVETGEGEWHDREDRTRSIRRSVNRLMRAILKNQLAAVPEELSPADAIWRDELEVEVSRLREERLRLPWADGLPDPLTTSLEPYRHQLTEGWSAMSNILELTTFED